MTWDFPETSWVRLTAPCAVLVDGLVAFDGAAQTTPALTTICASLSATYGGSFGLFDELTDPLVNNIIDLPNVRAAFQMLIDEHSAPDLGTRALSEALMKQCLVLLLRSHFRRTPAVLPCLARFSDRRLAGAVQSVLRMPAAPTSLDRMAADAGMSRSAFTAAFKQAFGESPMAFVQKTRLHYAANLLAATDLPVKVVAASAGFPSRTHFSRSFRTAYGFDPTAWRKARLHNAMVPENDGRGLVQRLLEVEPEEV